MKSARPGISCLGVLLLIVTGCDRSADTAPADIRGAPIAQAQASPPPAHAVRDTKLEDAKSKPETPNSKPTSTTANFDLLASYAIEVSDDLLGPVTNDLAAVAEKTNALIPKRVHALNQASVSIKGFMLPLKVEDGLVTELLVMKDQSMCCYGTTPKLNEWVSVKMKGRGVRPLMDQPVTLFGTLHVGEMRENGYLTGIYRLEGERMEAPEE